MSAIRNRRQIERRIRHTVDRLVEAMQLEWLDIYLLFDEDGDRQVIAKSVCDFQYRRVSITWTLAEVAVLTDAELRATALHELVHALLAPLWSSHPGQGKRSVQMLNELATENVSRAVLAILTTESE